MTRQSSKKKAVSIALLSVCGAVGLIFLYVAVEVIREYNEWGSAAMFGVPGIILIAVAIIFGVSLKARRK